MIAPIRSASVRLFWLERKRVRNPSHKEGGLGPFRGLDAALAAPTAYRRPGTEVAGIAVPPAANKPACRRPGESTNPGRAWPSGSHPLLATSGASATSVGRSPMTAAGSTASSSKRGARHRAPQFLEAGDTPSRRPHPLCAAWRASGRRAPETCIHHRAGLWPRGSGGRGAPRWPRLGGLGPRVARYASRHKSESPVRRRRHCESRQEQVPARQRGRLPLARSRLRHIVTR